VKTSGEAEEGGCSSSHHRARRRIRIHASPYELSPGPLAPLDGLPQRLTGEQAATIPLSRAAILGVIVLCFSRPSDNVYGADGGSISTTPQGGQVTRQVRVSHTAEDDWFARMASASREEDHAEPRY